MKMEHQLRDEMIFNSLLRINESYERIENCVYRLNDEQIWNRPNDNLNSIGNLVIHLGGNISQYILKGLGGKEFTRKRDEEFDPNLKIDVEELISNFRHIIEQSNQIIENCTIEKMNEQYKIQGFDLTGFGIIMHVVEHLSYHTGQIALLTKYFTNSDLGFYEGHNLEQQ